MLIILQHRLDYGVKNRERNGKGGSYRNYANYYCFCERVCSSNELAHIYNPFDLKNGNICLVLNNMVRIVTQSVLICNIYGYIS